VEHQWSESAAKTLVDLKLSDGPRTVTWFNHHTLQVTMDAGTPLSDFDYIGLDGSYLRLLVAPDMSRTSADLLLPALIDKMGPGCRIGLIGSSKEQLVAARGVIEKWPTHPEVVLTIDGYSDLADEASVIRRVGEAGPNVLILGLGAPLQDEWALRLKASCHEVSLILTCGGWIDQITQPTYYPTFAYKFRINWLIRVAREPRRLWRRYTVDVVRAVRARKQLRSALMGDGASGLEAMESASRRHVN
jgi:exopolysaccharide biosynthesis WecB/TagA/CpsF family protein